MLHNIFLSTTALHVARPVTHEAGAAFENFSIDRNAEFVAWYAAPMLAAMAMIFRRL